MVYLGNKNEEYRVKTIEDKIKRLSDTLEIQKKNEG